MGSLNGDVMVMRNGRSTSQVSVYNYPEHLNPFYEDDQHKRLRFWKISKKDNEGRRNSFSIGNLKDMWAFKSFRMKKKSSTLGINKTSESPPTMRRDYVVDNGGWNTFDHRLRSSNTSSINGDSFQRNATYRSSLQTLPTSNDRIGLNRNDGYRSTIQVTRSNPRYQAQQKQLQQQQQTTGVSQNRRYVYGGSVTPQPLRNTRTNVGRGPYEYDCDNVMIRRSSQSSMVSTNPFESDDDDENEDINSSGMKSVNGGSTTTLTSRTARKKRRAPAPPTPIHGRSNGVPPPTIRIESSYDNTQEELRIKEDIDIANLTAEIESFVKTKSNDDVEITLKDDVQTATTTTSSNTSSNNKEKIEVKQVEEKVIKETTQASKNTSPTTTSSVVTETTSKEKTMPSAKTNGQVTTEIVTVTTTTKTKTTDVTKPLENVAHVSTEIVTKTDESKEIISNGAIPKKPTNNSVISTSVDQQLQPQSTNIVTDLCIKETNTQELPQKPIPLKRQMKPEAEEEVGHVECIHVHVESPRATPRKEHPSGVSSFKTNENVETTETITTKTPFVLTSPPTQRRKPQPTQNEPVIKEAVKIVGTTLGNERHSELTIKEERINTKPEILVKPTLSPKPVTKEANGKIHGFAEIHKPMRKFTNTQNGHVRKASRDENISPPIVPLQNSKEEENKINNSVPSTTNNTNGVKLEEVKLSDAKSVDTLKIVEPTTSINSNGVSKPVEREETKEVKKVNFESSVSTTSVSTLENHNEVQRQEDEFDLLYRPKPASHMEWKRSTLAPLETNIPPEKRKSVKDIIESINRSQRLLNAAANKDFTALQTQTTTNTTSSETVSTHQTSETHSSSNLSENLKILDERQKEIERLVEEMTPTTSNATTEAEDTAGGANSPSPAPSNCNNEYTEAQKLDNNEIFQKCKVKKEVYDYRETSPISSNLDWNPVPKPKRTKPGHE